MERWKNIGSNIIKLEGYDLYVTYIDSIVYISEMISRSGHPQLDPDGCINWDKLEEPPNQRFLNLVNAKFGTSLTMNDFGKIMKISEMKEYVIEQKKMKGEPMTDSQARWLVKNLKKKKK